MLWLVPAFGHAYGGIQTIRHVTEDLQKLGISITIAVVGPANQRDTQTAKTALAFPHVLAGQIHYFASPLDLDGIAKQECVVATGWQTAFPAQRIPAARRLYFLQDLEAAFFPAGSRSALIDATYDLGFEAICNTPGLHALLGPRTSRSLALHLPSRDPVAVPSEQRAIRPTGDPIRIIFFGRPGVERNGFVLAAEALRRIKARFGDAVDLVAAGEEWAPADHALEGVCRNLGLIDAERRRSLYATCDIGLVLTATPSPSMTSIEFMACGVATVTNRQPGTSWLFQDGYNASTVPPIPALLAEALGRLVEEPEERSKLATGGYATVAARSWSDELNALVRFLGPP